MIKKLKKFQIKLTPFNATKDWKLSTSNNQDLLLMDDTSSLSDEPVALEYIDYGSIGQSQPIDNFECNISLEQQPDDLAVVEEGLNVSGFFYPELDPTNQDGTFKRVIWHQVYTMFYNQYKDPTKIWGATNIDFDLSQTKRKISDEFKIFNIPTDIFGDTIVPLSITFEDTSLDDNFVITDDGNANLFAGMNLFSKKDELGNHPNIFIAGSNGFCNDYFAAPPTGSSDAGAILITDVNGDDFDISWSTSFGGPTDSSYHIINTGTGDLIVSGVIYSGVDPATFEDNQSYPVTIAAGDTLIVTSTMTPNDDFNNPLDSSGILMVMSNAVSGDNTHGIQASDIWVS